MQAYESDELVYHGGLRVSFGMQLMAASSRIETELPNISWPFLLLHGTADKLCDIRGSNLMYNQAKSTDKKMKVCGTQSHSHTPAEAQSLNLRQINLNTRCIKKAGVNNIIAL